jgi:hypothetical protein
MERRLQCLNPWVCLRVVRGTRVRCKASAWKKIASIGRENIFSTNPVMVVSGSCPIVGYFRKTHFGPLLLHGHDPQDAWHLENGSSASSSSFISKASSFVSSSQLNSTTSHGSSKPTAFQHSLFPPPLRRGPCNLLEMRDEQLGEGPGLIAGGACALSEARGCIEVAKGIKEGKNVLGKAQG